MSTFWDLFRQSVILQAFLTVMLWGVICYLVIVGHPVPDILAAGGAAILGFWFGTKVQSTIQASAAGGDK